MKFLFVAIAFYALFWLLRRSLRAFRAPPRPPEPAALAPTPMLRCAECGLHLPRDEALPGRGGVFCGPAHRAAHERKEASPP